MAGVHLAIVRAKMPLDLATRGSKAVGEDQGRLMALCPLCGLPYELVRVGWTYRAKKDAERFVVYLHTGGRECRDALPERTGESHE